MHQKTAQVKTPGPAKRSLPVHRVIILGAGRSMHGAVPSAVIPVNQHGCVLDWLLGAFSPLRQAEVCFIGGYRADVVMDRFRDIDFLYNPNWAVTGPVGSLSLSSLVSERATYISYSDVVYRPRTIREMEAAEADIVLAIDSRWRVRYDRRSKGELEGAEKVRYSGGMLVDIGKNIAIEEATGEYAGVMKLSANGAQRAGELMNRGVLNSNDGIPEIVRKLNSSGLSVAVVDVLGEWAELNASQDLARFVLGTKAESLERLKPLVRKGHIGDLVCFTHQQWETDRERVLQRIDSVFPVGKVIVRSSAIAEDGWSESAAGAFKSVANVAVTDSNALISGIEEVLESYGDRCGDNQVLIQEMLQKVSMSGVAMTRTLALGAPYYVINYDNITARTDTVTSGDGQNVKTMFLHRGSKLPEGCPQEFLRLVEVLKELEGLVGHDSLDVEFAFTAEGLAHVLQVRPIAVSRANQPVDDELIAAGLARGREYFKRLQKASPWLVGDYTRLSVMSDWNPAEIVGTKPGRLAFTVYRHLITDEVWARQRAEYGYRDVRPCNLLVDILGHPYVDVRATFNSFVPASLPDELARKLVNHYLTRLANSPELHDKVEFDILFTCLTFDFDSRVRCLRNAGLDAAEIERLKVALRSITREGIFRCDQDIEDLRNSKERYRRILDGEYEPLERAYLLLEDARLHSIPCFAHLARGAFVAVSLLRSLVDVGITSAEQTDAFLASLRTVSGDLQNDAQLTARGEISWETFVARYGHLRPGTYDITSPCYASDPEAYLRSVVENTKSSDSERKTEVDPWGKETRGRISEALRILDIGVDIAGFERFLRQAIEGREYSKFIFTRNLNAALEAVADFGNHHGISRAKLACITIGDLLGLRSAGTQDVRSRLERLAIEGAEDSFVSQAVCLPAQICCEEDFECFEQCESAPNFVTGKRVCAKVEQLQGSSSPQKDLAGKIALIPSADPGFDWIFARGLAGLITMYGGTNSHMAIRAAEFGLPAAIGVGETLYDRIGGAELIELDCASRQIRMVR